MKRATRLYENEVASGGSAFEEQVTAHSSIEADVSANGHDTLIHPIIRKTSKREYLQRGKYFSEEHI